MGENIGVPLEKPRDRKELDDQFMQFLVDEHFAEEPWRARILRERGRTTTFVEDLEFDSLDMFLLLEALEERYEPFGVRRIETEIENVITYYDALHLLGDSLGLPQPPPAVRGVAK